LLIRELKQRPEIGLRADLAGHGFVIARKQVER
jgi:hypothetical protein